MSRTHIHLPYSVWRDPRWTGLTARAQLLYNLISCDPLLESCGASLVTPNRWSQFISAPPADLFEALRELAFGEWIVLDESYDELFVADFMEWNYLTGSNFLASIPARCEWVKSPLIRYAIADKVESIRPGNERVQQVAQDIRDDTYVAPARAFRRKIPTAVRYEVHARDGFRCLYCGHQFPYTEAGAPVDETVGYLELDHIKPYSLGGGDGPENLRSACSPCNQKRGVDDADAWAARLVDA